jgi:hypothetical protein
VDVRKRLFEHLQALSCLSTTAERWEACSPGSPTTPAPSMRPL